MKFPPTADSARVSEIFSSLQGEGTRLGERHLFVRFEECNIHCTYCDELDKQGIEMSLREVLQAIDELEKNRGPHSCVSLTGGEPLLYLPFLKPLLSGLKQAGYNTYLETSGILHKALGDVIHYCDVIAMDLKPASVTGEKNFFEEHRAFLRLAKTREAFIKIILSKAIDTGEFDSLINIVSSEAPALPVILQPVSAEVEGHEDGELMSLLAGLQRRASAHLRTVRIVPRLHRILKIR